MQASESTTATNLYDLSRQELRQRLSSWGYSDFYAAGSGMPSTAAGDQSRRNEGLRPEILAQLKAETYLGILPVKSPPTAVTASRANFCCIFKITRPSKPSS